MPFTARNQVFERLAQIADVSTLTREEYAKYDRSIKAMRDAYCEYKFAEDKGRAEGLRQGLRQGEDRGKWKAMKQLILCGQLTETGAAIAMNVSVSELREKISEV